MFEMARDHARNETDFEVVGGYLSPVNDAYRKPGLEHAQHRINMCQLACLDTSDWLMVDQWEALVQQEYMPTAKVLDHFNHEINTVRGGIEVDVYDAESGRTYADKRQARIMLLAGSDLIQTMSEPGVWDEKDLHHILGMYGCFIIERAESEIDQSIFSSSSVHSRSPLALYRDHIHLCEQLVRNDVSSTKVRLFLRKQMSVEYLIPGIVVKYINMHGLYRAQERENPAYNQRAREQQEREDAAAAAASSQQASTSSDST